MIHVHVAVSNIGSLGPRNPSSGVINHHLIVHASSHFTTRYLSAKPNNLSKMSNGASDFKDDNFRHYHAELNVAILCGVR